MLRWLMSIVLVSTIVLLNVNSFGPVHAVLMFTDVHPVISRLLKLTTQVKVTTDTMAVMGRDKLLEATMDVGSGTSLNK